MDRLGDFLFALDRDEPVLSLAGDGDVSRDSPNGAAIEKGNPADFRQQDPLPIELETLRIAEGVGSCPLAFEGREALGALLVKGILQSPVQVHQGLLDRL